ncbi:MAG: lysophospholipid acyltransferase family protein [Steroidobacteraceae bacterium]
MIFVRSVLLTVLMLLLTLPYALLAVLLFFLPAMTRYRIIATWADCVLWVLKHVVGMRYRVIGREHLPGIPVVFLSKHQSAWETIALQQILPPLSFVLKRELLRIPFFGWGLAQFSCIAIDRKAGRDALEQVVEQGRQRLKDGFSVIVFPEGTRVPIGSKKRYKPGGAWLAQHAGVPVVPIAHNAGEFWRRNAFLKRPGEITVSIGPAITTADLTAAEINDRAENWIETEMHRLFPHHYQNDQPAE